MLRTVDRYLLRELVRAYVVVIVAIISILALENLPRLSNLVEHVDAPVRVLGSVFASLLPEYVAIANPVAVYLAVAWTVRTLHARGEWQIFSATGMGLVRIMAMPIALALIATGFQFVVRAELQPRAEQRLDALLIGVGTGAYGFEMPTGQVVQLSDGTNFFADRGHAGLRSILIRRGSELVTADRATLGRSGDGATVISLLDGRMTYGVGSRTPRSFSFRELTMRMDAGAPYRLNTTSADRMDRLSLSPLWAAVVGEAGRGGERPATAAGAARLQNAIFCLALPWFGLIFGAPPRRGAGGGAILLGMLLIVVNLRSTAFVEQMYVTAPLVSASIHIAAWTALTILLVRWTAASETGRVDRIIADATGSAVTALRRLMPRRRERLHSSRRSVG